MNYKELIIGLLEQIDSEKFLKRIYISLREYVKARTEHEGGTYQENKKYS